MEDEFEIRENLQDLSTHIQGVGRMIGSTKINLEKLITMRDCLKTGSETLDIYIKMVEEDPTLL